MEKLFQTLFARNYYFNAIINSIIFPASVEIHETRFVAGTFTQPSEQPVIFQKKINHFDIFQTFYPIFPNFSPKFRSPKCQSMVLLAMYAACQQDFYLIFTCPWQSSRSSSLCYCARACQAQVPAAQFFMTRTGATSHALCRYLGLGTARDSARRIPFEVIAFAR